MLLKDVNRLIKALSKSGVAIQFYLGYGPVSDPLDLRTTFAYKIRRIGDGIAYGRGIVIASDEPDIDELKMAFESAISTIETKFGEVVSA